MFFRIQVIVYLIPFTSGEHFISDWDFTGVITR